MRALRAILPTAAAAVVAVLSVSPAALAAATVTHQAQEADAGFLAFAPPPAGGPGALCLVDTGVTPNPDIAANLVSATALDGGTGNDLDPQGHGTEMAMTAAAVGGGMTGAWPQLKIVSVRATDTPTPGQEPTFEFDNYWQAMQICIQQGSYHVKAIDLAMASPIPPSPDQAQNFANVLANAHGQNIAVVAAAGNNPGAIEEPGAEPGVLAVGADTAESTTLSNTSVGATCSFSASQGLTFYAPGCGLDAADPFTDQSFCCWNGTSQASAFAAAVIVALMSYDPSLTYSAAEQDLVSTTNNGDLDVAAAFNAAGLGAIVNEGNANIPQPPSTPATPNATPKPKPPAGPRVRSLSWRRGVLRLVLAGLPKHARTTVKLVYSHRRPRTVKTRRARLSVRTRRPVKVLVRVRVGRRAIGALMTATPT